MHDYITPNVRDKIKEATASASAYRSYSTLPKPMNNNASEPTTLDIAKLMQSATKQQ